MHNRQNALHTWLSTLFEPHSFFLTPVNGDASFRRYFRLHHNNKTLVVVDAPPDKESLSSFLTVAALLDELGINTPKIHNVNKEQGFAILEDFGNTLLLHKLSFETADNLYTMALNTILQMQAKDISKTKLLPIFDSQLLMKELDIFYEWFLEGHQNLQLSLQEKQILHASFSWLTQEISQQPKVLTHRDYHSRNIMILPDTFTTTLGLIDFQDAVLGPFTYDLVSLLRDCYIQWSHEEVLAWVAYFHKQAPSAKNYTKTEFIRAFDLCGLQRHLKVLGVFARLYLRDNKQNYLQDLPLTLHYVMSCLERYPELHDFHQLMLNRVAL